jgi:cysteinyl-tRNA synthetase
MKQMDAKRNKAVTGRIATLKRNEATTKATINEIVPELVSHVIAGGNVAVCNNLLSALSIDRRRAMFAFLNAMLPHVSDRNALQFGKKLPSVKIAQARVNAFRDFVRSGLTVYGWLEQNTKTEAKETDWAAKLEKDFHKALRKGLDANQILAILHKVVEEEEQKAKDKASKAA